MLQPTSLCLRLSTVFREQLLDFPVTRDARVHVACLLVIFRFSSRFTDFFVFFVVCSAVLRAACVAAVLPLLQVVVMPRMMSGMNPEELAEMQKMQSNFSMEGLRKKLETKAQELQQQHPQLQQR